MCKETHCIRKELFNVCKETYNVCKETYNVCKETYNVCKETYCKWGSSSVGEQLHQKRAVPRVQRDLLQVGLLHEKRLHLKSPNKCVKRLIV